MIAALKETSITAGGSGFPTAVAGNLDRRRFWPRYDPAMDVDGAGRLRALQPRINELWGGTRRGDG